MVCKNKLFVFLLLGVFMISFTSAMEIDNWVNYENNDMKVRITNWLNIGEDLGTAELKSHKSVNEVLHIAPGKNKTVMYYDFNWNEKDSLGEVEFINMTSGEQIEKDYHFVIWDTVYQEKNNYSTNCNDIYNATNNSYSQVCDRILVGTYIEEKEGWVKLVANEIPKGKSRIGLVTDVNIGDTIDGIWTMAGKKIKKHAVWTEDLNVGLMTYYKLDDDLPNTNIIDSINNINGTLAGGDNTQDISVSGKINLSINLDGTNDYINGNQNLNANSQAYTFSAWINADTLIGTYIIFSTDIDNGDPRGFELLIVSDGSLQIYDGNAQTSSATGLVSTGQWYHVAYVLNGANTKIYLDGVNVHNKTANFNNVNKALTIGVRSVTTPGTSHFDGKFDEIGIWNRTLSQAEVQQLYNNGNGITYTEEGILVTLNQPENNTIQNDATVDFNWTISPTKLNITNWTLTVWYGNSTLAHQHINTTINTDQETTVIHNDTLFLDESYIWNVESCGDTGDCDLSSNWTFTLDTAPPEVNITYPPEGFIVTVPLQNITLNYTIIHPVGNLSNCFYNTSSNSTPINLSCTTNTTSLLYPAANPDNLTIYVFGNDTAANLGSDNVTISKDVVSPTINSTAPNGTLDYNYIGGNETLNVTFSDSSLDSCWYNYNGTNITIDGCLTDIENSTQFILEEDNLNMTIYANDSLGNTNSTFIEWDYIILEYSTTYDSEITEGETNQISTKIVISESESITSSVIVYGGVNYTTSVIYDGTNYTIVSNNNAPIVASDTNFSFNFIVSLDGTDYNTTTNNQTVNNSDFSVCGGVSNDTLLNMSLFNEETLTSLIGNIEFNSDIISKSSGDIIESINGTFSNTNSGSICFSPISSYSMYYIDAEIRYFSDGYSTEFYYIQNGDMANYPTNLSLYDLNQNDSTEFSVTYKNNAFIFEEDAVIQLQRRYIGEGIYRVVEAPLTSDGGKAILHIDLNTNKYQVSVVKDGELLDFFDNIVFSCDNELAGDCTYSLDGTVDPNNDVPIEDITDFVYSVSIDEDNQTVTVLFAVPSGTPSSINVVLEQIDMFGNLTSCNTTVITSAGSITCDYTDTIEKSILELSISKNDVQLAVKSYVNDPDLDMDGMNFFIVFLFMISLVGMAISSPEWMILISVMVLIISGTLLLLKGMSLVMGLGAIAWVVVAAAIIIMKMSKQEDR